MIAPTINPVLLVTPDPDQGRVLVRALQHAGFQAFHCPDSAKALDCLQNTKPGAIVADFHLPDLSGAEFCRVLRAHPDPEIAHLPLLFLTEPASTPDQVEALEAGADDALGKPVEPAVLTARLHVQQRLHEMRHQLEDNNAQLEAWRRNHQDDLEAARHFQRSILPRHTPSIGGWQIAAHYHPFLEVGGDIYDWSPMQDNRWLFWIADVTGHGLAAALVTALAKLLFRHAAAHACSPGEALELINQEFFSVLKGRSYLSAAAVALCRDSGEISFAGAGHPPLLIARGSHSIEAFTSQAPPIGIRANLGASETRTLVEPEQTLLLYTDGLYSQTTEGGRHLAPSDLPRFLPAEAHSAREFLERTVAILDPQGHPLPDDVAAVALHRT